MVDTFRTLLQARGPAVQPSWTSWFQRLDDEIMMAHRGLDEADLDLYSEHARAGLTIRAHRAVGTEGLGDRPGARGVCISHLRRSGTILRCDMDVRARGHGGGGTTTAVPPPRPPHGTTVGWEPTAGAGREVQPPRTEVRDGRRAGFVGGVGR